MVPFQNIELLLGLLLLLPLASLFIYVLKWKKRTKKKLGDEELVNALMKDYSHKNFWIKFVLVASAIALCIVGAANLRTPKGGSGGARAGIDIMVALDVSNSMLAQDIKPNRLERAKQVLNKLIDNMNDNRMGLIVFAGKAFLQMPLTADVASAKLYVSNASPAAVPVQGTVIGDALRVANAALETKEKKYKAIVLITDGEDHDEKLPEVMQELQESGVVVHTIGIGSPEGSPIYDEVTGDYKKDMQGNTVVSKLNDKDLKMIAEQTGGDYHFFTNADEVANAVMNSLNQMEKKQIGGSGHKVYASFFQLFVLVAFILLLLEIIIPEKKMKWFA